MRHLMNPLDLTVEEIDELIRVAEDIEADPKKYAHACEGKKLATLFYEPSTRTRLSHEAAMLNLGSIKLRIKGRERCRYYKNNKLLRRYSRNAAPKRRRADGRSSVLAHPCYKRR